MKPPKPGIESLSVAERLALIQRLWDSLASDDVGRTPAQQDELARRIEDAERNLGDSVSWAEAQRRIRARNR